MAPTEDIRNMAITVSDRRRYEYFSFGENFSFGCPNRTNITIPTMKMRVAPHTARASDKAITWMTPVRVTRLSMYQPPENCKAPNKIKGSIRKRADAKRFALTMVP